MTAIIPNDRFHNLRMPNRCASCDISEVAGKMEVSAIHYESATVQLYVPLCSTCIAPLQRLDSEMPQAISVTLFVIMLIAASVLVVTLFLAVFGRLSGAWPIGALLVGLACIGIYNVIGFTVRQQWSATARDQYQRTKSCVLMSNLGSTTQVTFAAPAFAREFIDVNNLGSHQI